MSHETDVSFLDTPEILEIVFPVVYSPYYPQPSGSSLTNAATHFEEVEAGVRIGCAMWAGGKELPTVLYFHGNGETVRDHDWIAPFYIEKGVNLFVADYRGYGDSDGQPTISNLMRDCHAVYGGFKRILQQEGYRPSFFVMGRSLGSMPAVELAYHYQDELKGLILESGSANNLRRLWSLLGTKEVEALSASPFLNKEKIRTVRIPTCVIHGEHDQILPVQEAVDLYEHSGAEDKSILIIPDADHNDLMIRGHEQYFDTIEQFVKKNS